jgi:hypothetical protein
MAVGERISQQTPIGDVSEINVQTWLVADNNVTAPGTGVTRRFNKDQLAQAMLNTGPIGDAIRAIQAVTERLAGYLSQSAPADVSIQDGMYWKISSAPGKPPAGFPWSGLYKRVNGQWVQTGDLYSPRPFDMWANLNDSTGYYWFANDWNIRDVNVDGVTIRHNPATQLIEIAPGGINPSHLTAALAAVISGALQTAGGAMTGNISLIVKTDYNNPGYAASIGDIEALDLGAMDYVGGTDPVTVFGALPQGARWLDTDGSRIGVMGAGGSWDFANVQLINGLHADGIYSGDSAGYKKEARYSRASASWVLYSTADVTAGQFTALDTDAVKKSVIQPSLIQDVKIDNDGSLVRVTQTLADGSLAEYAFTQAELDGLKGRYDIGNAHRYVPPVQPSPLNTLLVNDLIAEVFLPDTPYEGGPNDGSEQFVFADGGMVKNRWYAELLAEGMEALASNKWTDTVQFGQPAAMSANKNGSVSFEDGKTLAYSFRKYTQIDGLLLGDKIEHLIFGTSPVFTPGTADVSSAIILNGDELRFTYTVADNIYKIEAGTSAALFTVWDSGTADWADDWETAEWQWTKDTKTLEHKTAGSAVTQAESPVFANTAWGSPIVTLLVNPSAHIVFEGVELYNGDTAWAADTAGTDWAWIQSTKSLTFPGGKQTAGINPGSFTSDEDGSVFRGAERRFIDYTDTDGQVYGIYSNAGGWGADFTAGVSGVHWNSADKKLVPGPEKGIQGVSFNDFTRAQWCNGTWLQADVPEIDVEETYLLARQNQAAIGNAKIDVIGPGLELVSGILSATDRGLSAFIRPVGNSAETATDWEVSVVGDRANPPAVLYCYNFDDNKIIVDKAEGVYVPANEDTVYTIAEHPNGIAFCLSPENKEIGQPVTASDIQWAAYKNKGVSLDELSEATGDVTPAAIADDTAAFAPDTAYTFKSFFQAAVSKLNALINRFTGGVLNIANGGTGASGAAGARTNLGVPADSTVVHNTGNETIAGVKTFSTPPNVPLSPVLFPAVKKYTSATTALKFKFRRPSGFNTVTDGSVFYSVKARIKILHTGAFFDVEASWIPQTGNYDFCSYITNPTVPAGILPAYFYLANEADGFYGWIPLETAAGYHWTAQAEMRAADTADSIISGVYEPVITFETANPSAGRRITAAIISTKYTYEHRIYMIGHNGLQVSAIIFNASSTPLNSLTAVAQELRRQGIGGENSTTYSASGGWLSGSVPEICVGLRAPSDTLLVFVSVVPASNRGESALSSVYDSVRVID